MPDVVVKESNIEGKGVFAARGFRKGEVVIRWDVSHQLSREEADALPESEKRYVSFLEGKYVLMQPPARFVNHSCDANTTVKDFCDVAKRDIEEGEEITDDYSEDEVPGFEMKCSCGSSKCRGVIRVPKE